VFITAYHKGFYTSNNIKIVHQYLPREVGELVVWYLWLVLPFMCQLAVTWYLLDPSNPSTSSSPSVYQSLYLWAPNISTRREWSSKRLREVLK
jgi:hypothetical protein